MFFRCVAAISNSGGKCIEHFYEDNAAGHASAEAFARQYDKPGMGVYDCVSPLRDQRRTKENVALIEGLHVDIDAYKINKSKEEVIKRLQDELDDVGILSCINSSGRGIHAHFLFREPIEAGTPEAEKAQQVLKRLVAHLGADPQPTNFNALMRRLGTTNSRAGGGPCKKLLDFGTRCELSDVEAYLDLVSDKGVLFPPPKPKTNESDFPEYNGPVDVDARLAAMKFEDKNGAGDRRCCVSSARPPGRPGETFLFSLLKTPSSNEIASGHCLFRIGHSNSWRQGSTRFDKREISRRAGKCRAGHAVDLGHPRRSRE